jgi:hypothetical protein
MSPGRISCKLNLDHIADHCLYANISRDTAGTIAYAMEEPLAFDLLWLEPKHSSLCALLAWPYSRSTR